MSVIPGFGATQPNQPQSVPVQPRWALYFVHPPALGSLQIEVAPGATLGRDPDSALAVISHPTVSRRHAEIQSGFGSLFLSDLGSSNGTRVNGALLTQPSALAPQNVVRFGDALAVVDERMQSTSVDGAAWLGTTPAIGRLRALAQRAAAQSVPALILGETGTGKEWLAADLHRLSGRAGPYVKLSCAELAPQLIESQLFGHERGAFTGADTRHPGLFVAAHGGTLFLDEIGELPLELQAKLLRVLQEGEVRPVGSIRTQAVNVRVIAATHRDLARDVEQGKFRRDLYARLSVFELELPPLRARRQDILFWVERFCERRGRAPDCIAWQPVVAERLLLHAWPDNLRGLDRLVERLLAMGSEPLTVGMQLLREVMPELAVEASQAAAAAPVIAAPEPSASNATEPPRAGSTPARAGRDDEALRTPTREEFLGVYEATGRNVRATSKHFGRDRRQVYRWLESFGIER